MTTRRACILLLATLMAALSVLPGLAQMDTESPLVRLERVISTSHALPGSRFSVRVIIQAIEDLTGVGVKEELPLAWTIHPLETEGAVFKRSTSEWVFPEGLSAGETRVLTYEVVVAPSNQLYGVTLPACYHVTGTFQATVQRLEIPIPGDALIEVDTELPIPVAVAHMVPESAQGPDRIDLRLGRQISEPQLQRALQWWATDSVVPWTGGEIIDLAMMERLIALYETCTPAEEALPLSIDPDLVAVRSIGSFLPCDSVLLPEGCLNPGLPARQFEVTVEIVGTQDAYGVGLAEWFPETWRVTPVEHPGFSYRPSRHEWVFPARLKAGETVSLTYLVEVVATTTDSLSTFSGCCGRPIGFIGEVSSGLDCSRRDVTGESEIYVWECLPVLLAISRWDVEEDRLDATLSDIVSFPQIQRAVEFWLSGTAVPHTCGYTVGYHMLKTLVAYWLAGAPITGPLPGSVAGVCEDPDGACYLPICPEGGLCHLSDAQDVEDYVGIPFSPQVSVTVEGTCQLTCASPTTTLTLSVRGGTPPYRYEWWGPNGELLGTTETIEIDRPGVYSATVISVGGCEAGERVVVTGDYEAPQLSIDVGGVLGCDVPEVALTASILGGRAPYEIRWLNENHEMIGSDPILVVTEPGTYELWVTGVNGCEGRATAEVRENVNPPTAEAGDDQELTCEQTSVLLTGSATLGEPPYEFEWMDEAGSVLATTTEVRVEESGRYTLTVIGANGCMDTDTVDVTESVDPPVLRVEASGPLSCAQSSTTLHVTVTEGRPPFAITWHDAAGNLLGEKRELTVSQEGTYLVRVEGANGCSAEAQVTVETDMEPPVVDAGSAGNLTCAVTEIELNGTASGGTPPYAYEWTDATGRRIGTAARAVVRQSGDYTLTVTGANGCSASDQVAVSEDLATPSVLAEVDGVLTCANTAVTLSAEIEGGRGPFHIEWTDAQGTVVGRKPRISVSAAGTYMIHVRGANGCSADAEVMVSEDRGAPIVHAGPNRELSCAASEVLLQASVRGGQPPYTYAWTRNGTSVGSEERISVNRPGTYELRVVGANGCSATDTVQVMEDRTSPVIRASVSGPLTCSATQVTLSVEISEGRSPFEIRWTDSTGRDIGSGPAVEVSAPGPYTVEVGGANGCSASATVEVLEDRGAPVLSVSVDGPLTCSEPATTLSVEISGGRSPYAIQWMNAGGTVMGEGPSVIVDQPGSYVVRVTGANGCSADDEVTVVEDRKAPEVQAAASGMLSCSSPDVMLGVTIVGGRAPYTVRWESPSGAVIGSQPTVMVRGTGTYTVTVEGANGCSVSDTVSVIEDRIAPVLDVSVSGPLTCAQSAARLEVEISGGRAPYQVFWTNADGSSIGHEPAIQVHEPGRYAVEVLGANGCSASVEVTVDEDVEAPRVEIAPPDLLTCQRSEVVLRAIVSGGRSPYACVWSDCCGTELGTGREILVDLPGTYHVKITGANGCVTMASVVVGQDVEAPSITLEANHELTCTTPQVTLHAAITGGRPPYTVTWRNSDGAVVGTRNDVTVSEPGAYTVVGAGANGCQASAVTQVADNRQPPRVDLGPDRVLTCEEPSIVLSAVPCDACGPYTYEWTDECDQVLGVQGELTVTYAGTYSVRVTGANGCTATDTIVIANGIEPPTASIGCDVDLVCCGEDIVLEAVVSLGSPPYTFEWRDACDVLIGTGPTVTINQPGIYLLIVRTATGCIGTDQVEVREP